MISYNRRSGSNVLNVASIRRTIKKLNEQEVPSPYIVYVNGYFYEFVAGEGPNRFSCYGSYWSDWDSSHPACKWWEENIQ